jgi:hypothetical protein
MTMEQLDNWEAAVLAAGVTTVYNADDWERMSDARSSDSSADSAEEGAMPQH